MLMPPDVQNLGLVQHAIAEQFRISACSQQALCYYSKYTEKQLENAKDVLRSDRPLCQ